MHAIKETENHLISAGIILNNTHQFSLFFQLLSKKMEVLDELLIAMNDYGNILDLKLSKNGNIVALEGGQIGMHQYRLRILCFRIIDNKLIKKFASHYLYFDSDYSKVSNLTINEEIVSCFIVTKQGGLNYITNIEVDNGIYLPNETIKLSMNEDVMKIVANQENLLISSKNSLNKIDLTNAKLKWSFEANNIYDFIINNQNISILTNKSNKLQFEQVDIRTGIVRSLLIINKDKDIPRSGKILKSSNIEGIKLVINFEKFIGSIKYYQSDLFYVDKLKNINKVQSLVSLNGNSFVHDFSLKGKEGHVFLKERFQTVVKDAKTDSFYLDFEIMPIDFVFIPNHINPSNVSKLTAFPNPVESGENITIIFNNWQRLPLDFEVHIIHPSGQIISTIILKHTSGVATLYNSHLSDLPTGVYFLKIETNHEINSIPIIIKQ